jgi:anaphase-promoting complex subunit 2
MLSNRLLSQFSYNTEREIRNLELLKLRFGEASLQQCEVMLKDISDSKRINNAITGDEEQNKEQKGMLSGQPFPVNAVILSAQFWPQFKEQENLQLPKEVITIPITITIASKNHSGHKIRKEKLLLF